MNSIVGTAASIFLTLPALASSLMQQPMTVYIDEYRKLDLSPNEL